MYCFSIVTTWRIKTKGLQEERDLKVDVISIHTYIYIACITAKFLGLFLQISHGLYVSKLTDNAPSKNKKEYNCGFNCSRLISVSFLYTIAKKKKRASVKRC